MTYKVIVQKVESALSRNVGKAARELSRQVNDQMALGWEPVGGVAIGTAGSAPYLLQALVKRR
ncbi:MAG TPA: hypothetical protein VMM93_11050 [Vicinamibacterales bacterium]|nr:hypothetical protein [Vicinamibacterales bacterium]